MHLKANLIKWLKLFGGDTRRAIIGYIVLALIAAGGGVLVLTKTALTWVTQIANIPTPLWATILLILLCGLYTHLKVRRSLDRKGPLNARPETTLNLETQKPQSQPLPLSQQPTKLTQPEKEVGILKLLSRQTEAVSSDQIAQWLPIPMDKDVVEFYLDQLHKKDLIGLSSLFIRGIHHPGQQLWVIKPKGRKYLTEIKLTSQQGVQVDAGKPRPT